MKRQHHYKVTVEHIRHADPEAPLQPPLQFEARNHDEILAIAQGLGGRLKLDPALDADSAASLAIGLKLFGEVALQHRQDPMFAGLLGPLREFIQELKKRSQATAVPSSPEA